MNGLLVGKVHRRTEVLTPQVLRTVPHCGPVFVSEWTYLAALPDVPVTHEKVVVGPFRSPSSRPVVVYVEPDSVPVIGSLPISPRCPRDGTSGTPFGSPVAVDDYLLLGWIRASSGSQRVVIPDRERVPWSGRRSSGLGWVT